MNNFYNLFIKMIKEFMAKYNYSYVQLQDLTKIHDIRVEQSYINRIVNGNRKNVSIEKFKSICNTIEQIDDSFSETIKELKLM